ncbi:restriction endonuclease subunit M [Sphingobacteriales bacterium UPWRP_1]|nr:restriction endonuclease subunit M [Sphingobacteriales bacterium TSM_CSS]PSJ78396.1 restriction endonuclease subunit M [Sphingobacteriales bacterium UPWRP_1]
MPEEKKTDKQVKSKQRVADHGEVFTNQREVNAMLDLVKHETERIDSRFLEPACGEGVFLAEVLRRKLNVVEERYAKSQVEYEQYAFLAVSSLYGIDILQDNVEICRDKLLTIFLNRYKNLFKDKIKQSLLASIKFVLFKNIVHGNALSMKTCGLIEEPITFSKWELVLGGKVQQTDYRLINLLESAPIQEPNLFSDLGEDAFIPEPVKKFALKSIYNLAEDVQTKL